MRSARRKQMLVTLLHTGARRYAVQAVIDGESILEMNPAPGYDTWMPHDLQHFIVEGALRIEGAIYGQLAAGGTAGTFHVLAGHSTAREASKARAESTAALVTVPAIRLCAIRACNICLLARLAKPPGNPVLRAQGSKMGEGAKCILESIRPDERAFYTSARLAEIRLQFQRLSDRWVALRIGEGLTEPW